MLGVKEAVVRVKVYGCALAARACVCVYACVVAEAAAQAGAVYIYVLVLRRHLNARVFSWTHNYSWSLSSVVCVAADQNRRRHQTSRQNMV